MSNLSDIAIKTLDLYLSEDIDRYRHSYRCGKLLLSLYSDISIKPSERLFNTVILHDIGYSSKLSFSDKPNENGFIMLQNSCSLYPRAILNRGKNTYDNEASLVEQYATMVVDYCDTHVNHKGDYCTIKEKIEDIRKLYGDYSSEVNSMIELYDYLITVEMSIYDTIREIMKIEVENTK